MKIALCIIALAVLTSCSMFNQARRADAGFAKMERVTYNEEGLITSREVVEITNDEDPQAGFTASLREGNAAVASAGSKDPVFDDTGVWVMWTVGGSVLILIGAASLISRGFRMGIPWLSLIPRGPSWIMIFTGIGCVTAQYMDMVIGLCVVIAICFAGYFLSMQKNAQESKGKI